MRIYLTGFMGSGKSHVGQALAELIQFPFVDLDAVIEQAEQQAISNIFETRGEDAFRRLEQEHLQRTIRQTDVVVATGGGTVCFYDNLRWIKQYGMLIYLDAPVAILTERLKSETQHRPLLAKLSSDELPIYIEEKLRNRRAFYEQADVIYELRAAREDVAKQLATALRFVT